MQQKNSFFQDQLPKLFNFLQKSPTPFHAVHEMTQMLQAQGYEELQENKAWNLKPGGKYWVARNQSSLIAFHLAEKDFLQSPMNIIGSHTDSPCLKLKPNAFTEIGPHLQWGVEVYGSPLLATWFDRDLAVAGRIFFENPHGKLESTLIHFDRPIAIVPSLAIHLDRNANENRSIQKQKELPPLIAVIQSLNKIKDLEALFLAGCHSMVPAKQIKKIISFELCLHDVQPPAHVGLNSDFFTSARLDNLLSCWVASQALLASSGKDNCLIALHDHEEVGSVSYHGADGNFLKNILERIYQDLEMRSQAMADSLFLSCDNAHAFHPNFPERYELQHSPLLNHGPAVKWNANQRYATTSESAAQFAWLASEAEVEIQTYVVRTDMPCGSTIGPLSAAQLGIKSVDVGIPTLAMHSIRELAGWKDVESLLKIFKKFFKA